MTIDMELWSIKSLWLLSDLFVSEWAFWSKEIRCDVGPNGLSWMSHPVRPSECAWNLKFRPNDDSAECRRVYPHITPAPVGCVSWHVCNDKTWIKSTKSFHNTRWQILFYIQFSHSPIRTETEAERREICTAETAPTELTDCMRYEIVFINLNKRELYEKYIL